MNPIVFALRRPLTIMVLVVAIGFMQLTSAQPLATIFAIGGVVWLIILLALGSMDSFTRTDYPVVQGATTSQRPSG